MMFVCIGVVLILWIFSIITVYAKMKDVIDYNKAESESVKSELQTEINNLQLINAQLIKQTEKEREIDKAKDENKKTYRTGDKPADAQRAIDILSNRKK